jgi:mRNA interferase MazF
VTSLIEEWKQAGLIKESAIKPIIITIEKDLILAKLGQLQKQDTQALRNNLQTIFG